MASFVNLRINPTNNNIGSASLMIFGNDAYTCLTALSHTAN